MKLESLIEPGLTIVLDSVGSRDELLGKLSDLIADRVEGIDAAALEAALTAREEQAPTSTPEGVAFPHAMYDGAPRTLVATAAVKRGVSFGHADHPPCDLVFVLVGAPDSAWQHVSVLARLARICHAPGALKCLRGAADGAALYDCLSAEDARHG